MLSPIYFFSVGYPSRTHLSQPLWSAYACLNPSSTSLSATLALVYSFAQEQ